MASKKLKKLMETINKQGEMLFNDPATEEQIKLFEKNNDFILPEQYKDWLSYSDGGLLFLPAGIQLYGVSMKPIIDVNEDDRPDDDYVVIGALSSGDPILCKKESEQISIYNHEAGRIEEDEVYEDFHSFLNDLYELLGMEE